MDYDFDSLGERRGMNSLKWNVGSSELPMWVADMDFVTAPEITRAVVAKAASGVFGYGIVPQEFNDAIRGWWASRYGWGIDGEWISYCTGVMPAVSSLVRSLTEPGDSVVVQSPVYNCFYSAIRNTGRRVLASDLAYERPYFRIDWEDLEERLSHPRAKLFLLCNPQNPTGQIWEAEELARMGELADRHGVLVVSDEIHCDITEPGRTYVPFASAYEGRRWITLVSPAKSFSIPGLHTAAMIVADADLRKQAVTGLRRDEIAEPGSFAVEATVAAYAQGGQWVDQMREVVWRNKVRVAEYVRANLPELTVVPSQATYLSWVDCGTLVEDATQFCKFMRRETGLIVNPGGMYGENTRAFFRINLGCPLDRVEDALERLSQAVHAWTPH